MLYVPKPIDTSNITLSPEIEEIRELLAKNAHDIWASLRIEDGWIFGPTRNDNNKEHPCLVPYEQLPESEKEYDRNTAMETLKAIYSLGYQITKLA